MPMNSSTKDIQMKYTLGKILLLLLFCNSYLLAESSLASYTLKANKTTAVIKEPVVITFKAKQKDHRDHMFFALEPQKSKDYSIVLLNKKIDDSKYHDSSATFTYLLFPLHEKDLHIHFNLTIKTASDKAIKQSYVDDHDNSVAISTYDTKVKMQTLFIKINPLKHPVDLVGDFRLSESVEKKEISQFENLNLHYFLIGKGYQAENLKLLKNSDKTISLFEKENTLQDRLTKEGYILKKEYIYAITAKSDFDIPAVTLNAYSPTKHIYYTLSTKKRSIKVTTIDAAVLLDKKEFPKKEEFDFTLYKNILIACIIFFAGFLTAKMSESFSFKRKERKFIDIENTPSAQSLMLLLMHKYKNKDIAKFIDELEMIQYKKSSQSLEELKRQILKEF